MDDSGNTPLLVAIEAGQVEVAEYLLQRERRMFNIANHEGQTPLLMAAKGGHVDLVRSLLHMRADKQHRDIHGQTALEWAMSQGRSNVVQVLLQASVWVDAWQENLLHRAVICHDLDLAKFLLESGLRPDITDFQLAVDEGCFGIVALMLAQRVQIEDFTKESEKQPLLRATQKGALQVVRLLLNCSAKADGPNWSARQGIWDFYWKRGESYLPLEEAILKNHCKVADALLHSGASVNSCSASRAAAKSSSATALELLAKYRADLTSQDLLSYTCGPGPREQRWGFQAAPSEKIKLLASLTAPFQAGRRLLGEFIVADDASRVELLLEIRVSVDTATYHTGDTPLHIACQQNRTHFVKMLLDCAASPSSLNKQGETPLYTAVCGGRVAALELLLKKKADLQTAGQSGETLLTASVLYSNREVAELLVAQRASLNEANKRGMAPLHLAAVQGIDTMLTVLLEHRAAPDVQSTHQGQTPLHFAAMEGHLQAVLCLLSSRAAVAQKNCAGFTSLQFAAARRHVKVVRALLDAGADANELEQVGSASRVMQATLQKAQELQPFSERQ